MGVQSPSHEPQHPSVGYGWEAGRWDKKRRGKKRVETGVREGSINRSSTPYIRFSFLASICPPTQMSTIKIMGIDPGRPIQVAEVNQQTREPMFFYPQKISRIPTCLQHVLQWRCCISMGFLIELSC